MRSAAPAAVRLPLPQKPRRSLRARRRRARLILAGCAVLLIAGAAWGVSWASYLPRFTIQTVSVSGTDQLSPALVSAFIQTKLYPGTHPFIAPNDMFRFDEEKLGKDIEAFFPRVKSASISRPSFFSTDLEVRITERQPFALWCASDETCYQMDDSGFLFAAGPQASSTPTLSHYIFWGGVASSTNPVGSSFVPAHLPGILSFMKLLPQADLAPLGATIVSDEDFDVPVSQGFYLKASFGEDAGALLSNLQLVLSSDALQGREGDLEYIDLRFGDKVYYKLKGAVETGAAAS